jgi:putative flippase GtrA
MNGRTIAARYALFALLATGLNLGTQGLVLSTFPGPFALFLAIGVGTVAGIVLKYVLDCRFIFAYVNRSIRDNLVTFIFYAFMSGITTLVFWGIELSFDAAFSTENARYLGGIVGLLLGYTLKYQLDKRFVFSRGASS